LAHVKKYCLTPFAAFTMQNISSFAVFFKRKCAVSLKNKKRNRGKISDSAETLRGKEITF